MQILFYEVDKTDPVQLDFDAVPSIGDSVIFQKDTVRRVAKVEWDLSDNPGVEPLGARVVRVHCV